MPRDSERSSSTVSRAWSSAASMVSPARRGPRSSWLAGPAEVHAQPDQPLLRAVVDVALEPAQRGGLGRAGRVAAALDPAHLLLELGAAAEQHVRQAAVQRAANRTTSGRVTSAKTPIPSMSTLSASRLSPKPDQRGRS